MKKSLLTSYLFCLLTIFFFSTIEPAGKILGFSMTSSLITGYRFLTGGFFLYFLYRISGKSDKILFLSDYLKIAFCGILNVCISMQLLQLSIYYGKASVSAVLISSNPVFVLLWAYLILGEKPSFQAVFGMCISFTGLLVLLYCSAQGDSRNLILSYFCGFSAACGFALYTVISKKLIPLYGNLRFNSFSFLLSAPLLLLSELLRGETIFPAAGFREIIILIYLGTTVSGIAYYLFFRALENIPAASGASFFMLKPLISPFLSFIILHEKLSFSEISGIFLVIIGMIPDKISFKKTT